jgi:septal ring-binding cell division protein DamX
MRPESLATGFFETPARNERLQLLAYLLRNAAQPVYLRGPSGAGKTSAAALVAQAMADVAGVIWLKAERAGDLRSVFAGELARAGLPAEPWPAVLEDGPDARDWLVVVDEVDRLDPVAAQELARLPLARVRLLLLGEGGLDGAIPGPVQFLDLPPLNREQAAQFLRLQAGPQASRVTDDLAAGLYRATDGQPGALLAALDEVLRQETPVLSGPPPGRMRRNLAWGGGAVLALALAVVLLFQDSINDWLIGEPASLPPRVVVPTVPSGIRRETAPAPAPGPGSSAPVSESVAADDAAAPGRPAVAAGPGAETASGDAGPDPLDAVLRDALAAMEAGPRGAEPAAPPLPPADSPAAPQRPAAATAAVSVPDGKEAAPADGGQPRPRAGAEPAKPPDQPRTQPRPDRQPAPASPAPAGGPAVGVPGPVPAQGAEVVDRSTRISSEPTAAGPRSASAGQAPGAVAAPPAVVESRSPPRAAGWLESRSPERYTLQLVGARDRDAVERFVARHGIKAPYAVFERLLDGRPWYALVAGDYPDRAAALRARDALPAGIRAADVWPRTFGSIQEMQRKR